MYNLIEYSSNYSEITGSLWFYSKYQAINFDADIEDNDDFKSFKYKTKLVGKTEVDYANGTSKNAAIAVPLKYLSNFWRSLEMSFINSRVELKLKWTKYCVLSVAGSENNINEDANANNIIFAIKDTKLYVPVVTWSAKDNQELPKRLSKGFERSVYWKEYKTKRDNINKANEFRYFLKSNFDEVNRLFVLVYSNHDNNANRFKAKVCYLLKGIMKNYNVIINGKNFYDQAIDFDIKLWRN